MLYRLRPIATLEWLDLPGPYALEAAAKHGADLDQLTWRPTESRTFSNDLLLIALRHGVATKSGILLDARHTVDLGHADEVRLGQQALDESQSQLHASHGKLMEKLMPGSTAINEDLADRIRVTSERAARDADEELAEVLAAPIRPELAQHWADLGGVPPK
ncbi:hypothetical protein [Nonomuraea sp. NPDC002799]